MKKAICFVSLIALLSVLCGCGESKTLFEIRPFSCKVIISNANECTEGVFVFENENSMSFELVDSEYINGVKVQYLDGKYNFICDGMSVNITDDFTDTPMYGIFEAVKLLSESQVEFYHNTQNSFELSGANREYIYTVDTENGRPLEIKSDLAEIKFVY